MLLSSLNTVKYAEVVCQSGSVDPYAFCVGERAPIWDVLCAPSLRETKPDSDCGDCHKEQAGVLLLIPDWVAESAHAPADVSGEAADAQLAEALGRLRHASSAVERRLGEGLRLFRDGQFDPLLVGPCDYIALARTELGMNPTRAREAVRLSSGLEKYSQLAFAYDGGLLARSHVLLLLGVIVPETEGMWVQLAVGLSYAQLREEVRAHRRNTEGGMLRQAQHGLRPRADDPEEMTTLTLRAAPADLHTVRVQGREMVEKVTGGPVNEASALEAICADWASGHMELMPEIRETPRGELDLAALLAMGAEVVDEKPDPALDTNKKDRRGTASIDSQSSPPTVFPGDLFRDLPDPSAARGAHEALESLRKLMATVQSLAWQTGRALRECRSRDVDFDAERRVGVSSRKAAYLRWLDSELRWRPAVRQAYVSGRLGWTKTQEILKICTDRTAEAWIEWAETATVRLLQRAVEAELSARELNATHWRRTTGGLPPSESRLRAFGILPGLGWAELDRIHATANIRCEERSGTSTGGILCGEDSASTIFARPSAGKLWRLRLPTDAAALVWAVLLAAMRKYETIDEGTCLRHVTDEFLESCKAEHQALGGRHPVQERDNYLCQFPDCVNRSVEADHIRLRSARGSDAQSNLISLCWVHHHAGKHLGRFSVYGEAPSGCRKDRLEPGPFSTEPLYFVVGSSGGAQRVWRNDRLLGTLHGVSSEGKTAAKSWEIGEIRCEADLQAWLRTQSALAH